MPEQEITFATFKEILTNASSDKVQEGRRRLFVLNQFRNSKFEDLVNSYQSPVSSSLLLFPVVFFHILTLSLFLSVPNPSLTH